MNLASYFIDRIAERDHRLMRRVHRWRAPRWIRLWTTCATKGGDGWLWYALGAILLVVGGECRFRAVGASALAIAIGIIVFLFLKRRTGRRRPCHVEPHCWATLLPPDQFSFPSGHTITAFAAIVPLICFYPGMSLGLVFCALSIAISRVLLGMHYLSDVIAGSAIGAYLGYCCFTLVR
jgi:undecaprenyl-diphosphatase